MCDHHDQPTTCPPSRGAMIGALCAFIGFLIALAVLTPPAPTYSLVYTAADGNEYVQDSGLSEDDCARALAATVGNFYCDDELETK